MNKTDKSVMFFSSSSVGDTKLLEKSGITDILVSYHYIKKSFDFYEDFLPRLKDNGGLFMTDSGAFSFFNKITDEMYSEDYWISYLEEYVKYLETHYQYIYCAANLDLDMFVGQDVVDKWNKKYFKPLEKLMNIVYVVHGDKKINQFDANGIQRFKDYVSCGYKYIGVASALLKRPGIYSKFYSYAKQYKVRLHGFGWTSIPKLVAAPFFSVDSTTWLGGVRYGTTYFYDGKNFKVLDYKKKFMRKKKKNETKIKGIDYEGFLTDKREPLNLMNLEGWKGARKEYLKFANMKLTNNPVISYAK